jgi:TPR repeat protein
VQRDLATAERLDGVACRAGIVDACLAMGRMYTEDTLVPFDLDRGAVYYTSACGLGDGAACAGLGKLLRSGVAFSSGFHERQQLAATLHARGCDLGRAESCLALAEMRTVGEGVSRNPLLVPPLLERGCAAGSAEGCYRFATFLESGTALVERDVALGTALVAGDAALGAALIKRDVALAHRLMLKACAGGDFPPCQQLK